MNECTCRKKQKSLADVKREAKEFYNTIGQSHADFKKGQKVKIIVPCQDFHMWYGETGTIISTKPGYLKIHVRLDEPREYENWRLEKFYFDAEDLIDLKSYEKIGPKPDETI
jgi:ribosomal protein L21E